MPTEKLPPFAELHAKLGLELPDENELPHRKAYLARLFAKHLTVKQARAMKLWLGWCKGRPEAHGSYAGTADIMGVTGSTARNRIGASIHRLSLRIKAEEELNRRAENDYYNRRHRRA